MAISLFQKIQVLHPELTFDDFLNSVIILTLETRLSALEGGTNL